MSMPDHARANFQTLLRAAADGNRASRMTDAATGAPRYAVCAVGRDGREALRVRPPRRGQSHEAYLPPEP